MLRSRHFKLELRPHHADAIAAPKHGFANLGSLFKVPSVTKDLQGGGRVLQRHARWINAQEVERDRQE
jgi:hypothetical protein